MPFTMTNVNDSLSDLNARSCKGEFGVSFKDKLWEVIGVPNGDIFPTEERVYSSPDGGANWDLVVQDADMGGIVDANWANKGVAVVFRNLIWYFWDNFIYSSPDGETWTFRANFPINLSGLGGLPILVFNNRLWVFNTGSGNNQTYSSPDGVTWTLVAADAIPRGSNGNVRASVAMTVFAGRMWLFGGEDQGGSADNDVHNTTDGITWTEVKPNDGNGWVGRSRLRVAVLGSRMVVAAGRDAAGAGVMDAWESQDGLNWTEITGLPESYTSKSILRDFTMVAHKTGIYIYGGVDDPFNVEDGQSNDVFLLESSDGEDDDARQPDEFDWSQQGCLPYAARGNVSDLDQDFSRCLVVDLNLNTIFPGHGFPFTVTLDISQGCAGEGLLPSQIFGGGTDGYIYETMVPAASGLGTPSNRVLWDIESFVPGGNTIFLKRSASVEDFLPVNHCTGLPVLILFADGTEEEAVVESNTNTALTLSSTPSTTPSGTDQGGTDQVLIAPMSCGVLFPEQRYLRPAKPVAFSADIHDAQTQTQPMRLLVFQAPDGKNVVDYSEPTGTTAFNSDAFEGPSGQVFLSARARKAAALALVFKRVGDGALAIARPRVEEDIAGDERGR